MKKQIFIVFSILFLFCISNNAICQSAPSDSIVYDSAGVPLWWKNQIIVKFKPSLVNIAAVNNSSFQSGMLSDFIDSNILVFLDTNAFYNSDIGSLATHKVYTRLSTNDTISITRTGDTIRIPQFWSTFLIDWDYGATGIDYLPAIDSLNKFYPWIEFAQTNNIYTLYSIPNDSFVTINAQASMIPNSTYLHAHINMDSAWNISTGKDNVRVGVYDTGINWDHYDFNDSTNDSSYATSRIKGGYNYAFGTDIDTDRELDIFGHGTHMASIIGAKRNNTTGMAGIAGGNNTSSNPGVSLYAMKVSKQGDVDISDKELADALIEGATSFNSNTNYGYGLHVMNFSFGGNTTSKTLKNGYRFCYENGVSMAAASGNDGVSRPQYPSSFKDDWILKTAASDENGQWASFSNYNYNIDFAAPGVGLLYQYLNAGSNVLYNDGNDGTSTATAHVSGVSALMVSYINNNSFAPNSLWPEDIEHMMEKNCDRINVAVAYDSKTGYGKVNAGRTLNRMVLPRYQLKHYTKTVSNSSNYTTIGAMTVNLNEGYQNLAAGYYTATMYKISTVINIAQPTGRVVLDVWPHAAGTNTWSGANPNLMSDRDAAITSFNQTTATIFGYVYHFTSCYPLGPIVDYWYPSDLNGSTTFALTAYTDNPSQTDVMSATVNDDMIALYPNPTNGVFTLTFGLKEKGDVKIDILDMSGKIVKSVTKRSGDQQHFETQIDLSDQTNGVYICRVQTTNGVISRKITLVH